MHKDTRSIIYEGKYKDWKYLLLETKNGPKLITSCTELKSWTINPFPESVPYIGHILWCNSLQVSHIWDRMISKMHANFFTSKLSVG